jgi:hypothetical protein
MLRLVVVLYRRSVDLTNEHAADEQRRNATGGRAAKPTTLRLSPESARSADRGFVWLPTCHPAQEQILPPDPDLSFFAREGGRGPPLVVLPARGQAASDLPTRAGGATSVSVPPARTLPSTSRSACSDQSSHRAFLAGDLIGEKRAKGVVLLALVALKSSTGTSLELVVSPFGTDGSDVGLD